MAHTACMHPTNPLHFIDHSYLEPLATPYTAYT